MAGDGNHLDLNNLPEEHGERRRREGKETVEEISSTTSTETTETSRLMKRNKGGKDESEKLYQCRFCPLKFYKSQALGGHMNRHRQEKEMETLNRARQLVYCNDGSTPQQPLPHIGCSAHTFAAENFHQNRGVSMGDAASQSRPFYSSLPSSLIFSHPFPQAHYSPLQPAPYNMYPTYTFASFPSSYPDPTKDFNNGQAAAGDSQYTNQNYYVAGNLASYQNFTGAASPSHGFTGK